MPVTKGISACASPSAASARKRPRAWARSRHQATGYRSQARGYRLGQAPGFRFKGFGAGRIQMHTRSLGPFTVSAVSMGCMSISHAYGTPPDPSIGAEVLRRGLELGYTMLDTAALYGFGANETLIGETLGHRRKEFVLASKGGMFKDDQGRRAINGRPEVIRANCDESLQRLRTDVIDLYYLHRWDKKVPIEESVGAMAELVGEGKV